MNDKLKLNVTTAHDYALILGMPGTGKTTTIAYIIQILVEKKKTILLTSYTHAAVDNLLLKICDIGIDFIRLGRSDHVHPTLKEHTIDYSNLNSTKALECNVKIVALN